MFVVINPMAGSCTADDVRRALERHFPADAWELEIYETTGEEQVAEIVRGRLRQGCAMVVAAGGDGTVSDVAEALVFTDIPLGIIPVGTANVLAHELGIPLSLDGACALLADAHGSTTLDAMAVGKRYYVLQIGVGLDALMIRDTERAAKRRYGRAAYLWTAARWLLGYQPRRFTIAVDGRHIRPRAAQVLIANGGVLGIPPLRWGPQIRPDDQRVDVCVIYARTLLDYIRLIWDVVRGRHRRNRSIRYLSAERSIVVSADRPLPIQADGEIIGETPVQVKVVPSAVHVIVPGPAAAPVGSTAALVAQV